MCPGEQNRPVVKLQEYLAMPEKTDKNPYYSKLHDNPEWRSLYLGDERFRSWGDYVGLLIGSWDSLTVWTCSGVMIASDLFLTNWHCGSPRILGDGTPANPFRKFPETGYWNEATILKDILIDMSWDGDNVSRDFRVIKLLADSKDLDFAILEVKPINPSGKVRPVRIAKAVSPGDHVWIVQHPLAMQKQISSCKVIKAESHDFTHQCDTEAGSSGAPVFNSQGLLVGIHHKGFELEKDTCKPLLPKLNRAVRIDQIMTFLRDTERYRPVYDRIPRK
jgi:V8-like Glu-specific endopeptidase